MRAPALAALLMMVAASRVQAQADSSAAMPLIAPATAPTGWSSFLPLMGDEARKRGITLPLPFGAGLVFYHLARDIKISDVRVGVNGAPPTSVSEFAALGSTANVNNLNAKLDAWILPFVNVYAVVGYVWNTSTTRIDVTLPPLLPNGPTRRYHFEIPTEIQGSVGGVGLTLAGGYGPYFMAYDVNAIQADLGFDNRFKGVISSIRAGWYGETGRKPIRAWVNVTDWNTFATATGTATDPGTGNALSFEVDQGPVYRYTYGVGSQYGALKWLDLAVDGGTDFHGGWYLALVPVIRF